MPQRNLLLILLSAVISVACYGKVQNSRHAAIFADTIEMIQANYVGDVDKKDLFEAAMDGMVRSLDQYSDYISPSDFEQFQVGLDQEFGGVGMEVMLDPETKILTVLSPIVGTPAYLAGVRAGDTILKINDESTEGLTVRDGVDRLRGKPDTSVRMTVLHKGESEPVEMTIVRAVIQIESTLGDTRNEDGSWNYYLKEHPRIGYVRITTFGDHTSDELAHALEFNGKSVDALILDLRENPGGLLDSAVDICNMFIDQGTIVSTRGRDGVIGKEYKEYSANEKETIFDKNLPMVVLINHYSASASEIVSACLQDYARAVIIGERSWGKGTVQKVLPLEGWRSALKLTTASYWRPSEKNIHRWEDATEEDDWGVTPDDGFEVKMNDEQNLARLKDRQNRDVVRSDDEIKELEESEAKADKSQQEESEESERKDRIEESSTNGESVPDENSSIDPQLQKAVEHLQEIIRSNRSPIKKTPLAERVSNIKAS